MLKHLHIQNYALISHLDIDFVTGFSVLTGETGAGKSIILGALNLVMGGKADSKSITDGEERCIIEAEFILSEAKQDQPLNILIRRELHANGRSRSFVNDEVVSQAELKQWASQLIDIHSQHENLLLADDSFQLNIVDAIAFGHDRKPIETYTNLYEEYIDLQRQLAELKALANKTKADKDYIQFQFEQLHNAQLVDGEMEQLEEEEYRLSHAEDIQSALQQALQLLDGDEHGAISMLHNVRIEHVSPELSDRIRSIEIELRDIVSDANRIYEETESNPARLSYLQERMDLINSLLHKHGVKTVAELIALQDQLDMQCQRIDSFDEEIAELQTKLKKKTEVLEKAANTLTIARKKVHDVICQSLEKNLFLLGVAHAKVDIEITPLNDYTSKGKDNIQFMFAANLNQSLRKISEVASGGEISRIMLCVKALIASTNGLPTIIFDEIDTGVSGEIASQMGNIMRQMAESRQIIAITHLPQIAAMGNTQYKVYKADTTKRTETNIRLLNNQERIDEIAYMLSGNDPTDAAKMNAQQLLNFVK